MLYLALGLFFIFGHWTPIPPPPLLPPPPPPLDTVYSSGSPPTSVLKFYLSLPLGPHCLLQDPQLQISLLHNFQNQYELHCCLVP